VVDEKRTETRNEGRRMAEERESNERGEGKRERETESKKQS